MDNQPSPMTPPPAPEPKKGMPPLAWAGIGCGVILLILVVVVALLVGKCARWAEDMQENPEKATAEMVLKFHPDLDLVSQDEEAGTMTIRNNKTDEVMTLGYDDIAEGRLTVTDAEGKTTEIGSGSLEKVPDWVPQMEGATNNVGVFHQEAGDTVTGMMSFQTSESAEKVEEFYKESAPKSGLSTSNSRSTSVNGVERKTLELRSDGRSLSVQIVVPGAGEPATVQATYTEKK